MAVEITIPSPGESITEVTLGPWLKSSGDWVEKDESLVEIESDKVTLEVPAPESGVLTINAEEGDERRVGDVIGSIDPSAEKPAAGNGQAQAEAKAPAKTGEQAQPPAQPQAEEPASADASAIEVATATSGAAGGLGDGSKATSLAKKIAADRGVDLSNVRGTGPSGRITKTDVINSASSAPPGAAPQRQVPARTSATNVAQIAGDDAPVAGAQQTGAIQTTRGVRREKMSKLRQRIAERLVAAQQNAAMLTTFNEADMTEVMRLRKMHKDAFAERHGVGLGFMSFFTKACVSALQKYPGVNAYIDGPEVEHHDYCDISVAVGTPKGLVVPVIRNAERMSFADIENTIKDLAIRARDGKLTIEEMTGGTFTISNGGVYGSLMSTPILNPPQSGILGMHKIMKRPMEDPDNPGQVALRPMMYLALSYDHRIVDGEQAVSFLVHVKECIENPERLLLGF